MVNCLRLAYVFISFVAGVLGSPLEPDCPRHRGLPDGLSRAENKVKGRDRAVYRLDLRDALKGYIPNKEYKLRVHTTAKKVHFNDATVVIDAVDSSCGAGSWVIDSEELYSPKGCPSVVTTQQKEPMGSAHFVWRAPSCGCVHFRARIHVNSTYFLDDKSVHIGPLAKIICPQDEYTNEPVTEQTNTVEPSPAKLLSRGDLLELLCEVVEAHDPQDVLTNDEFILKRTMSKLNSFERDRLQIAVEQRHEDLKQCCDIDSVSERRECIGDVRRVRIDRFCGSGEPDIPLTKTRYDWVKLKQPECCPQIGEARYICFNYTLSGDAMLGDEGGRRAFLDMDDFDPVHYVEDYPQASAIKEKFSTRHQGKHRHTSAKEENVNMNNVQYDTAAANKDTVTEKPIKESHTVRSNSKQVEHKDDSTEEAPKPTNNARKSKVQHSNADESVDEDDNDGSEEVDVKKGADRYLSLEECCMNGIDAGTKVSHQGFEGCFKMADIFRTYFSQWNRKCDRHFVICCMRVIDGLTSTKRPVI